MKPKILIVEGPCGSGKSTAIHATRARYPSVAFVDPDVLKRRTYTLGDWNDWMATAGDLGEDWRRSVAVEVSLFWARRLAALGRSMIVELCDTMQIQDDIFEIVEPLGYVIHEYILLPPLDNCLAQNRSRKDSVAFLDEKVERSHLFYSKKTNQRRTSRIVIESPKSLVEDMSRFLEG